MSLFCTAYLCVLSVPCLPLQIVPVTDILRAQQIQEDNEVQQSQQTTILQRYKSASSGNLVDIPGEDDKKSIRNRMRMKCELLHLLHSAPLLPPHCNPF